MLWDQRHRFILFLYLNLRSLPPKLSHAKVYHQTITFIFRLFNPFPNVFSLKQENNNTINLMSIQRNISKLSEHFIPAAITQSYFGTVPTPPSRSLYQLPGWKLDFPNNPKWGLSLSRLSRRVREESSGKSRIYCYIYLIVLLHRLSKNRVFNGIKVCSIPIINLEMWQRGKSWTKSQRTVIGLSWIRRW